MGHISVTGLSLSDTSKTIDAGKSFTLSAQVLPVNATNNQVIYSSSNTAVAVVDSSGMVTGKSAGNAIITVKTVQGRKTASCSVTVNKAVAGSSPQTGNTAAGGDSPKNGNTTATGIKKAVNPLKISARTAKVKYKKLKKKAQTLAVTKVIKFTKDAKDKKSYTLSSAKKGKKSFKKYFKINKKTGKLTVK